MFENRKVSDTFNNVLMSVDGTYFLMVMTHVKSVYTYLQV